MKKKNRFPLLLLLLGFFSFQVLSFESPLLYSDSYTVSAETQTKEDTLPFKKKKQMEMGELDELGRATWAHIQLQDQDEPQKKRAAKLKYNPVGWHNYKFYYEDGSKEAWLMNRGHLIGYQFSGLNDEGRNLVPMTAWLNSGNYKGTNDSNPDSMLYYENRLDSWLATHPNYWLDYKVTPIYTDQELIPRQIVLQYVGIDKNGELLPIRLGGKEEQDAQGITRVILDNVSPNATIDYTSGTATNTVLSASQQEAQRQAEAEAQRQAEAAAQQAQAEAEARAQAEAQAAADAQAAEQAQQEAQVQSGGGYTRDYRGRWHRPNGQYASKAEIAAAGLPW